MDGKFGTFRLLAPGVRRPLAGLLLVPPGDAEAAAVATIATGALAHVRALWGPYDWRD